MNVSLASPQLFRYLLILERVEYLIFNIRIIAVRHINLVRVKYPADKLDDLFIRYLLTDKSKRGIVADIIEVLSEVYHECVTFRTVPSIVPSQMLFKSFPRECDALIFETGTAVVYQVLLKHRYHDFIGKCVLKDRVSRLHRGNDSCVSIFHCAKF